MQEEDGGPVSAPSDDGEEMERLLLSEEEPEQAQEEAAAVRLEDALLCDEAEVEPPPAPTGSEGVPLAVAGRRDGGPQGDMVERRATEGAVSSDGIDRPSTVDAEPPPHSGGDSSDLPEGAPEPPRAAAWRPPIDDVAELPEDHDQVSAHVKRWLRRFIDISYALFHACRQHRPFDLGPLQKQIANMLLWLERDALLVNALELELEQADFESSIPEGHDDLRQLVIKSVMMLLYAIKTTAELRTPFKVRLRLVTAAVLHHIGMAQVPERILSKSGRLSPEELAEIREAPAKGMVYLQRCGITDEYVLRAASEFNERVDGSGPRGLQGKEICYSARLIGLLSMFEAMIHKRSYRKRLLPREAVRVVVQKYKHAFDRAMLKALLDAISLYPVGSYVRLNSREIGKVIFCHPRLPLRPVVRVMMDEYGEEIPPREIDLKQHPNLMIEQCAYEDDLSSLFTKVPE